MSSDDETQKDFSDFGSQSPINSESPDNKCESTDPIEDESVSSKSADDSQFNTGSKIANEYLSTIVGAEVGESTAKGYETHLRGWVNFLDENNKGVLEGELADVKDYIREMARNDLATETVTVRKSAIKGLYKYIRIETDYESKLDLYAVDEFDPSKFQTRDPVEIKPLDSDEVEKLIAAIDDQRNRLMVKVGLESGARNESLREIELDDVDLDDRTLELENTKTGGTYQVPLSKPLALELQRWMDVDRKSYAGDQNPYLFPSENEGKIGTTSGLNKIVKSAAKRAGIQEVVAEREPTEAEIGRKCAGDSIKFYRVTVHTLRHTFSHLLEEAGLPTEARQAALDHENIDTTKEHYSYGQRDYEKLIREMRYEEKTDVEDDK